MTQATSDYISGAVTIQGLGNGTDFSETIAKLKQIEEIPARRLLKWKADWQERQDAFRLVRQQLVSLRSVMANMNSIDKFMTKAVSSSKSDVATATAKSAAQEGVYKLEVNQLATNSIWSVDTGFSELSAKVNTGSAATNFTYEYGGKTRTISVAAGTTLEALKNLINNDAQNPGVQVSLIKGASGYTFQMRGKDLGSEHELHITHTDLNGFPPKSDYNPYSVSYDTGLAAGDSVNDSGKTQSFVFYSNSKKNVVTVENGTTLSQLATKINALNTGATASGVTARLDGGKLILEPSDPDAGTSITAENKGVKKDGEAAWLVDGLRSPSEDSFAPRTAYSLVLNTGLNTPQDAVNPDGTAKYFAFTHAGMRVDLPVPGNSTLNDFVEMINANSSATGVTAKLSKDAAGKQVVTLSASDGKPVEIIQPIDASGNPLPAAQTNLTGLSGSIAADANANPVLPTSSGWFVQQSQDAKIRVNGWPAGSWLTVSSNTVDGVDDGMTFNLKEVGTTTLTVATDTEQMKENVLSFIEAVNAFRSTILELTKLDSSKQTVDPSLATSLYDMQKGSILTGNYGVQLLSSQLKQATAGMPLGFMPMKEIEGYLTGDIFTSLSQIGIKTDASGSSGMSFGLLVLNTDSSLPTLEDALAKNPQAVAEFFAAKNLGSSNSSNFSFTRQIDNYTMPGTYDVKYTVNSDGSISAATINGKPAKYDSDTGELTVVRQDPASSNSSAATAKHLTGAVEGAFDIDVQNLAEGAKLTIDTGLNSTSAVLAPPVSSDTAVATAVTDGTTAADYEIEVLQLATAAGRTLETGLTAKSGVLSATEETISFDIDGAPQTLTINAGETLEEFVNRVNRGSYPVSASMTESGGTWQLGLTTKATGAAADISNFATSLPFATVGSASARDAEYTVDGVLHTSAANTISDPESGIKSLTLKAAGTTTITSTPKSELTFEFKIKGKPYSAEVKPGETLQGFVDRINASSASPIKLSIDDSDPSNLKLAMLSKLTGSDVTIEGFSSNVTALSGSRTSSAGIDANFTVNGAAKTSKSNDGISTAIPGLEITLKKAGESTTLSAQKYNDADGISIHPDNLTAGNYNGTVSIKQGKINEIMRLLDGPPNKSEEGMLGSKGALQILQDNYDGIIAGIDAKIEREDDRITKWERLMKLRFARLDATLKQYDSLSKSIESQIKTLSSSTSS